MAATDISSDMKSFADYIDLLTSKVCIYPNKEKMLLILKYFHADSSGQVLESLR